MRPGKKLYVLDAYHGLFELDMGNGGHATQLVRFCCILYLTCMYSHNVVVVGLEIYTRIPVSVQERFVTRWWDDGPTFAAA